MRGGGGGGGDGGVISWDSNVFLCGGFERTEAMALLGSYDWVGFIQDSLHHAGLRFGVRLKSKSQAGGKYMCVCICVCVCVCVYVCVCVCVI